MAQELFFDPATPFLVKDVVIAAVYGRIGWLRWPSRADRDRVQDAMATVGIESLARRPVGRLSGGQQRKVLLARALAQDARLVLLDEPTANLDPDAKLDVARIVRAVEHELNATALVVSHEGGPLLEDAGRLIRLEAGRITHDGPMQELRRRLLTVEV
jgi:ABC-type Mn2+/Zn2+ transport system ATPase subunit